MTGAKAAEIADLHGFNRCIPFCDVGLSVSSFTCGRVIFSSIKNFMTLLNVLLISPQCCEL